MFGRKRECDVIDRLLDDARAGRSGVLVLHGEAGVGKTALFEYAIEAAGAFRIARTSGIEAGIERSRLTARMARRSLRDQVLPWTGCRTCEAVSSGSAARCDTPAAA